MAQNNPEDGEAHGSKALLRIEVPLSFPDMDLGFLECSGSQGLHLLVGRRACAHLSAEIAKIFQ